MTMEPNSMTFSPLSEEESRSRRKMSFVIALILGVMVTSFYVVTIVRLQTNMAKRAKMKNQAVTLGQAASEKRLAQPIKVK